jgi:hypothetical protein
LPEPTTIIATKGLEAAGKVTSGIIQRLFGPAADEIGEIFRDKVKTYRAKNLGTVLATTEVMLSASRDQVQPVSTRLLLPIIEGASLEDNESLSKKWAGLLASAATAPGQAFFHPSFPNILSELTALEASLLDQLSAENGEAPWGAFREASMATHGCSREVINSCHGNLFRLGLWRTMSPKSSGTVVQISPFGAAFLRAAQGPVAVA